MDEKVVFLRNAPKAVHRAVDELDSPDPTQRKNALLSLSQISHPTAREALVASVGNRNRDVRIHAALILVQFRDVRAVPGLIEALRDTSTPVGKDVAHAVKNLVIGDQLETLKAMAKYEGGLPAEDWSLSETAQWALVQFGPDAVDGLLQALHSRDDIVKDCANRTLLRIEDPAVMIGLIEDLHNEDLSIRMQAVLMLSTMRDVELAAPALIGILDNEDEGESIQMAVAYLALRLIDTTEVQEAIARWEARQKETPRPKLTDAELLEQAQEWFEAQQQAATGLGEPDEFVRIQFEDDTAQSTEADTGDREIAGATQPYVPSTKKALQKWRKAYPVIVKLREEYRELFYEGNTNNPNPRPSDYVEAVSTEAGLTYDKKTLKKIIEAGDAGLLGD